MSGISSNLAQVNNSYKTNAENKVATVSSANSESPVSSEEVAVSGKISSDSASVSSKSGTASASVSFIDSGSDNRVDSLRRAEGMISDLKLKNDPNSPKLAKEVEKLLKQSPGEKQEVVEQRRSDFVKYFNLDSPENFNHFTASMITEAGMYDSKKEDNFAVGTVIMNRVLSANIFEKASDSGKSYSIDRVIREKNQFQIVSDGRYDKELKTGEDRGVFDNSDLAKDILNGKFKDPEKGRDYSNMYYFQVSGLTTHGRTVSYKTPNGHVFSHGYDRKNATYPDNNLLSLSADHARIPKAHKAHKAK